MALTKTLKLRNGLTVEDAYIRIDAVFGPKNQVSYSVNTYLSEAAFKGDEGEPAQPFIDQEVIEMEPSVELMKLLYAHLLTQDRYAGAVDA